MKKVILDLPAYLLYGMFVYSILIPKHKAKYGVVCTPILYAVCSSFVKVIMDTLWRNLVTDTLGTYNVYLKIHMVIMGLNFIVSAIWLFDGEKKDIIIKMEVVYIIEALEEFVFSRIIYALVRVQAYTDIDYNSIQLYIGKILFLPNMYLCIIMFDIWRRRNEDKLTKQIIMLNFIIGWIQFFMLYRMVQRQSIAFLDYAYVATVISNMALFIGYFMATEVFMEMSRQQQRKSEMEKLRAEKQYQYNYYQLAQRQGEEIRDIRHDLRNQLQAIQYLLKTGDEKGEQIGKEMLENLKQRVKLRQKY